MKGRDTMGDNNGVLRQNEKQANQAVAKVMRITFIIFTLIYLSLIRCLTIL